MTSSLKSGRHYPSALDPSDFLIQKVSKIVSTISGVQLGVRQEGMVKNRLCKRIRDLNFQTSEEYLEHLETNEETERLALVSLLTTHHTYFFREYSHFDFIEREALPAIVKKAKEEGRSHLKIWSAATSSGQEAYSLAMFLNFHLPKIAPNFTFEIFGTDIDPQSIKTAQSGIYRRREIKDIPMHFLSGNWQKGTGSISEFAKAKDCIKSKCTFDVANLLSLGSPKTGELYDLVLCRNVFIYFNQEQIKKITEGLLARLNPHGFLMVGISESLHGLNLPVITRAPSVYTSNKNTQTVTSINAVSETQILKVLCVDDSPSVLALMKQILNKANGFEIVGTAGNGLEAAEFLKKHKVDLLTLDIHMPEQTGLEYLQKNYHSEHPPVVMVSSVSREDAGLAMSCLERGASDYVEKPALSNLSLRADEIRAKLLCAFRNRKTRGQLNLGLDRSFANTPKITHPDSALRVVVAGLSDRDRLMAMIREAGTSQPPTVILIEGSDSALPIFSERMKASLGRPVVLLNENQVLLKDTIYLASFSSGFDALGSEFKKRKTSMLVYGRPTVFAVRRLSSQSFSQVLTEDIPQTPLLKIGTQSDMVPATSFAYMSSEALSKS